MYHRRHTLPPFVIRSGDGASLLGASGWTEAPSLAVRFETAEAARTWIETSGLGDAVTVSEEPLIAE